MVSERPIRQSFFKNLIKHPQDLSLAVRATSNLFQQGFIKFFKQYSLQLMQFMKARYTFMDILCFLLFTCPLFRFFTRCHSFTPSNFRLYIYHFTNASPASRCNFITWNTFIKKRDMEAHKKNRTPPSSCLTEAVSQPTANTRVAPRFASVKETQGHLPLCTLRSRNCSHFSQSVFKVKYLKIHC